MSPFRNRREAGPDDASGGGDDALRDRYLELLAAAVTHTLYDPPDVADPPEEVKEAYRQAFKEKGIRIHLPSPLQKRQEGRDRPVYAQTMIGTTRLQNVRACVESVIAEGIPGNLIEAGCWRGGAGLMMKGVLEAYGDTEREVYLADSFQGVPEPDAERFPLDAGDINFKEPELAVPVDVVRANFERYGLLDDRVHFVEGWFKDSLPALEDKTWSVARLDGDLYESTIDSLTNLYPQLSIGGYLILDDYWVPNSRQAAEDFRREHGISEPIVQIDWAGAYWRRAE